MLRFEITCITKIAYHFLRGYFSRQPQYPPQIGQPFTLLNTFTDSHLGRFYDVVCIIKARIRNYSQHIPKHLLNTDMADTRFACDYAKRSTSSCKKCKEKLEKGVLRLAKVVPNFFHDGEGDMKQYHHAKCLFDTFIRARATTKIIESADDIEGFAELEQEEKDVLNQLIKETMEKKGGSKKTGQNRTTPKKALPPNSDQSKLDLSPPKPKKKDDTASISAHGVAGSSHLSGTSTDTSDKDDSFRHFRRLCAAISEENSYLGKTKLVSDYIKKGNSGDGFTGDVYLIMKLLLPGVDKTIYNLNSKQLVKVFSQIFGASLEEMVEDLEQGDAAQTIKTFFETSQSLSPQTKSVLSVQEVAGLLDELSQFTREDDQQRVLNKICKRSTANDLKMIVRLIKHDLRINAGPKHILDGLDDNAYAAFKASRDLRDVVQRVRALQDAPREAGKLSKKLSVKASLMTAVQPMLAEACKSVEQAFKKCPAGMFAEIKYDGERVQVHKQGSDFQYFSRSLKPVLPHKVQHFKDFLPRAFPHGRDLILDSEVLLIDTTTGQPLPFGSLGVHKKKAFKDACVCLFVFDCMHYNGESLMDKPITERRDILRRNMTEIPNHVMFSEMKHITEQSELQKMMMKVFREGLEGLVLKDFKGTYEPGKRHWLKVKKDYLAEGAMADSADLVVLGAYFGTGSKGGIMSIFLMGVHDPDTNKWRTVTKCHGGFDDKTLAKLQKEIKVIKIGKEYSKVPTWLSISKTLVPDFVVADPKDSPVWEITGAEFSKSESHTAGGISIRFPRCTKIRDDKSWKEATNYPRLQELYKKSKEYSDIPDLIGGSKGAGPSGINSPVKRKMESDSDTEECESPSDDEKPSPAKKPKPNERSLPECKYGSGCYQKSAQHRRNYSHPESSASHSNRAASSKHLPDVFTGLSFYLPPDISRRDEIRRFIIAYDGDVVEDFDEDSATYVVVNQQGGSSRSDRHLTAKCLWQCIKEKSLAPMK